MRIRSQSIRRRGQAVPIVAIFMFVGCLSMIALALDLGMMAIARNQCQAAADLAALAGARTLNGYQNSTSATNAVTVAANVAKANSVMGTTISDTNLGGSGDSGITVGDYWYNSTRKDHQGKIAKGFDVQASGVQGSDNYTLVQVTINFTGLKTSPFGKLAGLGAYNVQSTATAAHTPRDIVIVQDFSTSMRYDSMLAVPKYPAAGRWQTMLAADQANSNANYPQFGHYSDISGAQLSAATGEYPPGPSNNYAPATLTGLSLSSSPSSNPSGVFVNDTGELCGVGNLVSDTNDGPKIASYYYIDPISTSSPTTAFSQATSGLGLTTAAAGDNFLYAGYNKSTNKYAVTVYAPNATTDVVTALTPSPSYAGAAGSMDLYWELDGYAAYNSGNNPLAASHPLYNQTDYSKAPFYGYTQGPAYWGVTFMTWPPDPRIDPSVDPNINTKAQYLIQAIFGYDPTTGKNSAGQSVSKTYVEALYKTNVNFAGSFPTGVTAVSTWSGWQSQGIAALQKFLKWNSGSADNHGKTGLSAQPGTTAQQYEMICRLFNRGKPDGTNTFSADWRARFFYNAAGTAPLTDNSKLWSVGAGNSSYSTKGQMLPPWDNNGNNYYQINYNAILAWINNYASPTGSSNGKASGLATQMHGGGIQYYSTIPSSFSTMSSMKFPSNPGNISYASGANTDEMFWLQYINETLGLSQTSDGSNHGNGSSYGYYYQVIVDNTNPVTDVTNNQANCYSGIGSDWTWTNTTLAIHGDPSGSAPSSSAPGLYMNYGDNPPRPKSKFWFGPMTMLDFMANQNMGRNWYSGNCSEAPTYQCKLGVQAALNDVKLNHPNDNVALAFFSSNGTYPNAVVPLGRNYTYMDNAEWFAPSTIAYIKSGTAITKSSNTTALGNGEFTPYDLDQSGNTVPRGNGGTSYASGLMIAYNQFSTNINLATKTSLNYAGGGAGRIGSTRLVIVESDGVNKDGAGAPFNNPSTSTSCDGWYDYFSNRNGGIDKGASSLGSTGTVTKTVDGSGRTKWSVSGYSGPMQDAQTIMCQICNDQYYNGFSTSRKPVLVNCIAFGSLFDPAATSPYAPNQTSNAPSVCLQMMSNLEQIGSVQPVGGNSAYQFSGWGGKTYGGIAPYKIIYGSWSGSSGRVALMQTAFQTIMQQYGVDVVLIGSSASPNTGNTP